ncbi:hypothetical protein ACFV2D_37345, partial [Streptomyces capillispiralis]|uniref:hypothetical protein n=2 Tax=Streptomyces TaxID=1883 RepID=UPI0036793599
FSSSSIFSTGQASYTGESGLLVSTTYLHDGVATGIAIAAGSHQVDLAKRIVRRWSLLLRTRRVLVARRSWPCASELHSDRKPSVPQGNLARTVVGNKGYCPAPALARAAIHSYLNEGEIVFLVGPGPVPPSIINEPVIEVNGVEDISRLDIPWDDRVAFVVKPCSIVDEVTPLLRLLHANFSNLRGQHPSQWCYGTSTVQWMHRMVTSASDLTFSLGDPTIDVSRFSGGGWVHQIENISDLTIEDFANVSTIGVIVDDLRYEEERGENLDGTAATLLEELLQVLTGLGPLSIVEYQAKIEVSHLISTSTKLR